MSRFHFDKHVLQSLSGAVYPNATVLFFYQTTGLAAPIYDNYTGGSSIGTSIDSDSNGRVSVFIEPNVYRIEIRDSFGALLYEHTHILAPALTSTIALTSIGQQIAVLTNPVSNKMIQVSSGGAVTYVDALTSVEWGIIGGTLSDQTDLQSALDDKEDLTNKATDFTVINDVLYPSVKAVNDRINSTLTGTAPYFFYEVPSDLPGYFQMLPQIPSGAAQTISITGVVDNQLLASFATQPGYPGLNYILPGICLFDIHANKTGGTQVAHLYVRMYKSVSGVETLISQSLNTTAIVAGGPYDYFVELPIATTQTLNTTDRLVIKIYASLTVGGSAPDLDLVIEDDTVSRITLPVPVIVTGQDASNISSGIVSNTEFDYLDGVTSNIQDQLDAKVNVSGDTMTGVLLVTPGSESAPGLAVSGDSNTGLYHVASDNIAIATGGTNRLSVSTSAITTTLPVVLPLGTVAAPSLTFTGDTNTGIYSSAGDNINISTAGTQRLAISTTAITSTLQILNGSGSQSAPGYSFDASNSTGMYIEGVNNDINFSVNGVSRVTIYDTGSQSGLDITADRITIQGGTAADPTYTFGVQTTLGMFRVSDNTLGFSAGGVSQLSVSTTYVTSALPVVAPTGTAAAPSLTFTGDTNTGIYGTGGDELSFTTGGTNRLSLGTSSIVTTLPVVVPSGTAAAPSLTFTGDTDTGMYSVGTNALGFATNGVNRFAIQSGGTANLLTGSPTGLTLGASTSDGVSLNNSTTKTGVITVPHYTNSEEPMLLIRGFVSSTNATITIGGNVGTANAAKLVSIYSSSADTTTELSGVLNTSFNSDGVSMSRGFLKRTNSLGISASTTQTQGNGLLTSDINSINTANTNDTVTLPSIVSGMDIFVYNIGPNTLQIFPSSGQSIDALGTNNPTTLASGISARFVVIGGSGWTQA